MEKLRVCLMNDSFPPLIDGVANTVVNYAKNLNTAGNKACVVTPKYPHVDDSGFNFPVIRYPSLNTTKMLGYRAGYPFSPVVADALKKQNTNIIHSHCPMISAVFARSLKGCIDAPLILTYHTKYDIDIQNALKGKLLQESAIKLMVQNIEAFDEVWAVSRGAAQNLKSLGFSGECVIMPNGVDYPRGRVNDEHIELLRHKYSISRDKTVFLFVGRMMWYKGIRIIIDALAKLKYDNEDFVMLFVGDGADFPEIKKYAETAGVWDKCIFTGPVRDREALRAFYCLADAFLFPSTFDTNGLVVREAAAARLPSVIINGSCAAEGIEDCRTGFLIDENADAMYTVTKRLIKDRALARTVGENAQKEIYISWDDAVDVARRRYGEVLCRYRAGEFAERHVPSEDFLKFQGELMSTLSNVYSFGRSVYKGINIPHKKK